MKNFSQLVSTTFLGVSLIGCAGTVVAPPPQAPVQAQPVVTRDFSQISLAEFRACLAIEDMTKERLDCYDAIVPPEPRDVHARAKTIVECRFVKEEDARLRCFNSFLVEQRVATRSPRTTTPPPPAIRHTTTTRRYVRTGRGGCGSRGGAGYRLPSGKCASKRR